jgi:hypothetical protein
MKLNELHNHLSKISRHYEIPMRNAENAIAQAQRLELEMTRETVGLLRKIANIQISESTDLDETVRQQIQLRAHEEQGLRRELVTIEAEIGCLTTQLQYMAVQIEGLETRFADQVESDDTLSRVSREIEIAERFDKEREAQYIEIREEVTRKAPAYRENEFLMYLVRIQYGTPAYTGGLLLRYFDRWVARLCSFDLNRSNQIILAEMESTNEENFKSHTSPIIDLQRRRKSRQQELEGGLGLPALRADYSSLEASIATRKDRANVIQERLAIYRKKEDPHYLAATEALTEILKKQSPDEILAIVQQTPSDLDDQSLCEVMKNQRKIQAIHSRIPQLQNEHERTRIHYHRAKEIEREVRTSSLVTNEYDYRGIDVDALVAGYVLGSLQPSDVLRTIREHQSLIPQVVEDDVSTDWSRSVGTGGSRVGSSSRSSYPSQTNDDSSSNRSSTDIFSTSSSDGGGSYSTTDGF